MDDDALVGESSKWRIVGGKVNVDAKRLNMIVAQILFRICMYISTSSQYSSLAQVLIRCVTCRVGRSFKTLKTRAEARIHDGHHMCHFEYEFTKKDGRQHNMDKLHLPSSKTYTQLESSSSPSTPAPTSWATTISNSSSPTSTAGVLLLPALRFWRIIHQECIEGQGHPAVQSTECYYLGWTGSQAMWVRDYGLSS